MKTELVLNYQKKYSKRAFQLSIIFMSLFFIFSLIACNNGSQTATHKNESNSISKVEKPDIDIHAAALNGNVEVINQYVSAGADLNVKEPMGGSTPLITASVFGKTDVALALINAGANLDIQNNDGSTALHSAAFFCHTEIVKALIEKGVDKSIRNKSGATARESAITLSLCEATSGAPAIQLDSD